MVKNWIGFHPVLTPKKKTMHQKPPPPPPPPEAQAGGGERPEDRLSRWREKIVGRRARREAEAGPEVWGVVRWLLGREQEGRGEEVGDAEWRLWRGRCGVGWVWEVRAGHEDGSRGLRLKSGPVYVECGRCGLERDGVRQEGCRVSLNANIFSMLQRCQESKDVASFLTQQERKRPDSRLCKPGFGLCFCGPKWAHVYPTEPRIYWVETTVRLVVCVRLPLCGYV